MITDTFLVHIVVPLPAETSFSPTGSLSGFKQGQVPRSPSVTNNQSPHKGNVRVQTGNERPSSGKSTRRHSCVAIISARIDAGRVKWPFTGHGLSLGYVALVNLHERCKEPCLLGSWVITKRLIRSVAWRPKYGKLIVAKFKNDFLTIQSLF